MVAPARAMGKTAGSYRCLARQLVSGSRTFARQRRTRSKCDCRHRFRGKGARGCAWKGAAIGPAPQGRVPVDSGRETSRLGRIGPGLGVRSPPSGKYPVTLARGTRTPDQSYFHYGARHGKSSCKAIGGYGWVGKDRPGSGWVKMTRARWSPIGPSSGRRNEQAWKDHLYAVPAFHPGSAERILAPSVMFVELRRPPFGGGRTRLPSCETPYPLPCFCLLLDVQWFCG